jgi:sorbitol/mannitol transport system substrate-binding protein
VYDADDLLPAMRNGLSVDGKPCAAPFYGESSMLRCRKGLTDKAGIKFEERPKWEQVREPPPRSTTRKPASTASACAAGRAGLG